MKTTTIQISNYGTAIIVPTAKKIAETVDSSLRVPDTSVTMDFSGVRVIQTKAAEEIINPIKEKLGHSYNQRVKITNTSRQVTSVLAYISSLK